MVSIVFRLFVCPGLERTTKGSLKCTGLLGEPGYNSPSDRRSISL